MRINTNKAAWWFTFVFGVTVTLGGLFGVWLQGRFYEHGLPTAATVDEVRQAFTLPTTFTTCGSLIVSAFILSSPVTSDWPMIRRTIALVAFALSVLLATAICGYFAGSRIAPILH